MHAHIIRGLLSRLLNDLLHLLPRLSYDLLDPSRMNAPIGYKPL